MLDPRCARFADVQKRRDYSKAVREFQSTFIPTAKPQQNWASLGTTCDAKFASWDLDIKTSGRVRRGPPWSSASCRRGKCKRNASLVVGNECRRANEGGHNHQNR